MWFVWIGSFVTSLISFLVNKFSFKVVKTTFLLPLSIVYIGLMVTSFSLFCAALIYIINSVFNVLDLFEMGSAGGSGGGGVTFHCFTYLLEITGIGDSIKVGASLLVSDILAIVTLKATMAGKNSVKEIINIFSRVL